jgi:hypothetical protein
VNELAIAERRFRLRAARALVRRDFAAHWKKGQRNYFALPEDLTEASSTLGLTLLLIGSISITLIQRPSEETEGTGRGESEKSGDFLGEE